ncbi:translation initiation factor IF-2 [Segnochrobactraceae bacterium EtOH-i3]
MNDTNNPGDKTLGVDRKKATLSLRAKIEQGTVRQSFSHGRTKAVVVEKVKRRPVTGPEGTNPPAAAPAASTPAPRPAPAAPAPRAAEPSATVVRPAAPAPAAPAAPVAAAPAPAPEPAPAPVAAAPAAPAPAPEPVVDVASTVPGMTPMANTRVPVPPPVHQRPIGGAPRAGQPAGGRTGQGQGQNQNRNAGAPGGNRPGQPGRDGRPERPRPGQDHQRGRVVHRTLSEEEMGARTRALAEARVREAEERKRAEEDAKRRAEEEVRLAKERAEAEVRRAEEEARRKVEEEARLKAEAEARRREAANPAPRAEFRRPAPAAPAAEPGPAGRAVPGEVPVARRPAPGTAAPADDDDDGKKRGGAKRPGAKTVVPARPTPKPEDRRRGKLTLSTASLAGDDEARGRSLAAMRRRVEKQKRGAQQTGPREKISREVTLPETISIQELANRMAERGVDVIKFLMRQGQMHKITDVIDADTAELIATEMGHTVKRVSDADVEEGLFTAVDTEGELINRPPVVTIMGHVDHGKTSLLDAIRHANVVSGEAGGITQHIGAYQVEHNGQKITFIDTPGHAAFTAMRARGAKATDIVILVVAADDGVMPQTIEAIHHAKAAGVPIVVAINKIDKHDAKPERVRTELLQHEILVEEMGGETLDVEVSAKSKIGLDKLLDAILLQSEVLDLRANPDRPAEGSVIEAKLDKGRGPVASVLVQRGTLRVGEILIAGSEWGRVRALINDRGEQVKEAPPSMPVEVLGFQATPEAGDRFSVVENETRAREIADYRQRLKREKNFRPSGRGSLEAMMKQMKESGRKEFPLVIKADVQGSLEAIVGSLDKLGTSEVAARLLHTGVGAITESDVTLAQASDAIIIGFNVRANKQARDAADRDGVEVRYYNIIYDLVDDVKSALSGLLPPERRETFLGNAEIRQVFNITKVGKVAGCLVTDGYVERGSGVRLIRDGVVIHEGKLSTLKRFKDEVKEVQSGQECGMAFERYEDIREGDIIECFRVEEIARSL